MDTKSLHPYVTFVRLVLNDHHLTLSRRPVSSYAEAGWRLLTLLKGTLTDYWGRCRWLWWWTQNFCVSQNSLSSEMLPTRVASKHCSLERSSDWLKAFPSPLFAARWCCCWSLWRIRPSGRLSTPEKERVRGITSMTWWGTSLQSEKWPSEYCIWFLHEIRLTQLSFLYH